MTFSHRFSGFLYCCFAAALLVFITGCAPTKSQSFRTSFLPPSPRAAALLDEDVLISEAPAPTAELYVKETPNLPTPDMGPRNAESDNRLRRAEEAFAAGQKAYQQGKQEEARRGFNRAIDLLLSAPENTIDRQRLEHRLDQMIEAIYRYDVNGLGAGEDADKVVYDKSPLDNGILDMTFPIDPRLKSKVKEELAATSSQLPLEQNDSVLSYIHYFSTDRGHKVLSYGMKRAGRYKQMIRRVLDEEGLPQELIYLAQIESAFSPRAISRKRCVGLWQFSVWDGKNRGLNQTQFVDERMDPEKSTRAAAKHLHDLYNQFGDWYLAMAAYNCGPGCVDRAVQRTGYADFWKLRDMGALPKETTNYVPVIVAITIMAKNPKDYGLDTIELEPALEYETVKVDAPTNLALVADATERPITELRDMNPGLLRSVAPAGYDLHIPVGAGPSLTAALESIPANHRANWRVHKVEAGETLAAIAKRYRTAAAAIVSANNNALDAPSAGDVLIIPAAYEETTPGVKSTHSRSSASGHRASSRKSGKSGKAGKTGKRVAVKRAPAGATRQAGYRHVPSKVLHKKATVKTASLR